MMLMPMMMHHPRYLSSCLPLLPSPVSNFSCSISLSLWIWMISLWIWILYDHDHDHDHHVYIPQLWIPFWIGTLVILLLFVGSRWRPSPVIHRWTVILYFVNERRKWVLIDRDVCATSHQCIHRSVG